MRSGVKYDVRFVFREELVDPITMSEIGDALKKRQSRKSLMQLFSDIEDAVLTVPGQDKTRRVASRNLAAEFTTNRSSCSGNQYSAISQDPLNRAGINPYWIPPEQILDVDFSELTDAYFTGDDLW
jgi:hypothetical protein